MVLFVFIALILAPLNKKTGVKKTPKMRGQIAIVIDDWGYGLKNLLIIEQIKQPLTCGVLPGLKNSNSVMQKLNNLGFEIILHLPMDSKRMPGLASNLEKNTITLGLNTEQIHDIFQKDLSSIAFAKGVSNHMGSSIAEDIKVAGLVMAEVKKHKLYFFDSLVTSHSVCSVLAKKMKIKFAKRDVFLDNQNDFGYIKGQLIELINLARKHGSAIGIGHDRKNTLLVLKEMLPRLEAEGYKFVFLSQVVR